MGALAFRMIEFVFEMLLCACCAYFSCQDRFDSWLATFGDEFNEWSSRADVVVGNLRSLDEDGGRKTKTDGWKTMEEKFL